MYVHAWSRSKSYISTLVSILQGNYCMYNYVVITNICYDRVHVKHGGAKPRPRRTTTDRQTEIAIQLASGGGGDFAPISL